MSKHPKKRGRKVGIRSSSKEGAVNHTHGRSTCVHSHHRAKKSRSSSCCKDALICSPSVAAEAPEQVSRDALLKLAYVLKEAYQEAKRKGYVIEDGKVVKALTDSHHQEREGNILQ